MVTPDYCTACPVNRENPPICSCTTGYTDDGSANCLCRFFLKNIYY